MKPSYRDILGLANGRTPNWWDDHGVPRFYAFEPSLLGVYDQYAGLFEIACQSCGKRFKVGAGAVRFDFRLASGSEVEVVETTLSQFLGTYDYGDPPRHDLPGIGRCAGETMSSIMVRIVQAWSHRDLDWVRCPDLEGPVDNG